MARITAFIGSPRRYGNTGIIVDKLVEGINTLGIETEIIHLSDYKITGCRGCMSCSKTGKCAFKDDMSLLYPKIEQSDAYLFASPTYNYNMTAEMKALLDRLFCYYRFSNASWESLLGTSKKACVIGVCAGPGSEADPVEKDNMGFTILGMKKPLEDLNIQVIKELRYYGTKKYPVKDNIDFQCKMLQEGINYGKLIKAEDERMV